ncbi:MAG: hypothetical protein JNK72_10030 [Myxococcales bacterium]|nr:hypothetical protein [Myxococcales bacterium]
MVSSRWSVTVLALVAASSRASGQSLSGRVRVGASAGVARMMSASSREALALDLGFSARVDAGLFVHRRVALRLGLGGVRFGTPTGYALASVLGVGAGLELVARPRVGLSLDAMLGPGLTADRLRLGFDVGLTLRVAPHGWAGLTLGLRYQHLVAAEGAAVRGPNQAEGTEGDADAGWLSLLVGASLGPWAPTPRAIERPRDTDGDGVLDPEDRCPTQMAAVGAARRGAGAPTMTETATASSTPKMCAPMRLRARAASRAREGARGGCATATKT